MTQANHRLEPESVPVGELTYTDASRELDDIVGFFEQREIDVDQLVSRLERATDIVEELESRLRQTRVQVEQLVPKLAAVVSRETEPDAVDDELDDEPFEPTVEPFDDVDDGTAPATRAAGALAPDDLPGLF